MDSKNKPKLVTGDLDKILDIMSDLINGKPISVDRSELIRLANALQTYIYLREV